MPLDLGQLLDQNLLVANQLHEGDQVEQELHLFEAVDFHHCEPCFEQVEDGSLDVVKNLLACRQVPVECNHVFGFRFGRVVEHERVQFLLYKVAVRLVFLAVLSDQGWR